MIAYVFWHWRRAEIDDAAYVGQLLQFHAALRAHAPEGFVRSFVLRHDRVPWLEAEGVLEDWYLVERFADLETLNRLAVAGPRRPAHDDAARCAEGGAGGVYRLVRGAVEAAPGPRAFWFSKPRGMGYDELSSRAAAAAGDSLHALWQRQMVLGPGPEFRLETAGAVDETALPEAFVAEPEVIRP